LWKAGKPIWRNEESGDFSETDKGSGWKRIDSPRIALYRSAYPAMDEGWTRWLLENFGFAYKDVSNTDLQAGDLKGKFDVIVFPDQPPATITQGYKPGTMPEEYTGGLGETGAQAVKTFAHSGGTVLCFNHASAFCIHDLGAPATDVLTNRMAAAGGDQSLSQRNESSPVKGAGSDFYSPGSLLNVKLDLSSPLTRGLPENIAIWSEQSPAFASDQVAVAKYPESGILASGWLLGANLIAGKSAIVDAKMGEGHIVLFGMRPQYRAQSYQSFKLFFNALTAYQ
jgi:hypothetical protein